MIQIKMTKTIELHITFYIINNNFILFLIVFLFFLSVFTVFTFFYRDFYLEKTIYISDFYFQY